MSKKPPRKLGARILLTAIGALLILYGMGIPLLGVWGRHTLGRITEVRREMGDRPDPLANRYSYSVGYEFALEDGTVIYGNIKTVGSSFDAGIAKGSAKIVYLKNFPQLNMLQEDARLSPAPFIYLSLGVLLIGVVYSPKVKWPRKQK